jgi:hypothetical protein
MPRTDGVDVTVSTVVAASPETLYALVGDVTRMGEWSPETVEADWLDGATGPVAGARFTGRNRIGSTAWTTKPVVTVADPGRTFAFRVPGGSGATWTYTFERVDGGTRVTEHVRQDKRSPLVIRLLQRRAGVTDRAEHLRAGMAVTLERLATAAVDVERTAVR